MNCKLIINNKIDMIEFHKFYYGIIEKYILSKYKYTSDDIIYELISYIYENEAKYYSEMYIHKYIDSKHEISTIKCKKIINIRKKILFEIINNFLDLIKIPSNYNKINIIFNEAFIQNTSLYRYRKEITKETLIIDLFLPTILFYVYYSGTFFKFLNHIMILFCEDTKNNNICIYSNERIILNNIKNMRDDINCAQDFCVEYNYYFNENNNIVNIFNIDRNRHRISYSDIINKKIENDDILSVYYSISELISCIGPNTQKKDTTNNT